MPGEGGLMPVKADAQSARRSVVRGDRNEFLLLL